MVLLLVILLVKPSTAVILCLTGMHPSREMDGDGEASLASALGIGASGLQRGFCEVECETGKKPTNTDQMTPHVRMKGEGRHTITTNWNF